MFFADRLRAGELPLWNNLVGHGYPLVGESQTGAFYPFYLLFYSTLDVISAYNAVHLLHYVLTFLLTWMYARKIGLAVFGALLAALVYTYGWFPPRSCLEWAIVGGTYLPAALWCAESFLQSCRLRYAILLSLTLGLQLLAGHYNLAFITHLVLLVYIPLRIWFADANLTGPVERRRGRSLLICAAAMLVGFSVAAVQLLPSWQLKQSSQRAVVGSDVQRHAETGYDPGYGHLPPLYVSQIVAPWYWYTTYGDLDAAIGDPRLLPINSQTNKIEAHLYFGQVPLALIVAGLFFGRLRWNGETRLLWLWCFLGLAALVYATGWLLPLTRHLSGFSFFTGPGRFGMVTTLAAALFAGTILEKLQRERFRGRFLSGLFLTVAFGLTLVDLFLVSRAVTNTTMVSTSAFNFREQSEIRRILLVGNSHPRLLAPGANLATLTGVSSTPPYLGLGPAVYFDPRLRMPALPKKETEQRPAQSAADGQVEWLQHAGVTHVLSFKPLNLDDWPVRLLFRNADAMLNRAWAKPFYEPLYLYELQGGRDRVAFADPQPGDLVRIAEYNANRVTIEANSATGGRLVLTDLMSPGWNVSIDGQPAPAIEFEQMYRAVDLKPGRHTVVWIYEPSSVYWGAIVSLAALLLLAAVGHVRYWHPRWLCLFDEEPDP